MMGYTQDMQYNKDLMDYKPMRMRRTVVPYA